ncbi:MAG: hypothetical protein FWG48_05655 [Oscillospiraceae bacterium]|nr:hypothetical protein [Oscillospiraceae bacterium]
MLSDLEHAIDELASKGVRIVDPRQTYIAPEVDLSRIYSGSELHPGVRLTGKHTLIAPGAKIGTEGPATLDDSAIGSGAEVASGYLSGATMLSGSKAGANAHFRPGTLLEEDATTAHAVGLKQTILMHAVTLGSLINFCDALISGGSSRNEHSEVGSGFIHFNFTPWGVNGDKATPSLIGNVTDGVFLDRERIFLGGLSGIVGPGTVGFGAATVAGQTIRKPVPESHIYSGKAASSDVVRPFDSRSLSAGHIEKVRESNAQYIAQLYALIGWYENVRLIRSIMDSSIELPLVLVGAIEAIRLCVDERIARYNSFADEWSAPVFPGMQSLDPSGEISFPIDWKPGVRHDEWVRSLSVHEKDNLRSWISDIAQKAYLYLHYL